MMPAVETPREVSSDLMTEARSFRISRRRRSEEEEEEEGEEE
jgi:hypothetical protein